MANVPESSDPSAEPPATPQASLPLASDYVPQVCDDISLSDETTCTANALADTVELAQCSSGRSPWTIAGACVYLACLLTSETFSVHHRSRVRDDGTIIQWTHPTGEKEAIQAEISMATGKTATAIRKVYPAVAQTALQLRDWDEDCEPRLEALAEATVHSPSE